MRWFFLLGWLALIGCSNEAERGKNAKDAPDRPRMTESRPKPLEKPKPKPKEAEPLKDKEAGQFKSAEQSKIEAKDKNTPATKEK
ncbi:MAG: hypothetical protein SNJ82_07860 [Gemmataceae bacterium]